MADKAFRLGNMCDDLVDLTIEMCGKDEDKCPRFPKWSYATLVDRIMVTALDIQEQVIEANEHELGETRAGMQKTAAAKCIYLNHLIRIAWQRGYISLKQHDRWAKLVTDIKWKTVNWYGRLSQRSACPTWPAYADAVQREKETEDGTMA